jgi:hypothetical protein
MRYSALAFYSALLQAVGLIIGLGSLVAGMVAAVVIVRELDGMARALPLLIACGAIVVGLLVGIILAAFGQFCAVVMDIEANTHPVSPLVGWGD